MNRLLVKILDTERFSGADKNLIKEAFEFAKSAHTGQYRLSGEEYLDHPLHVALFLKKLDFDAKTVVAGLLHDTLEDTPVTIEQLTEKFGDDVAFLVNGVTKLGNIEYSRRPYSKSKRVDVDRYIASLKSMFMAMAKDIRVIFIKLADRYHNIRTLDSLPDKDKSRIAHETIEIYAPIAARMGMGKLKGQLEDLAFPYAYKEEYNWLIKNLGEKYEDRLKYVKKISPIIKQHLTNENIEVIDLHSRAKHYFSLYQKLKKLKDRNFDPDKIFDLVAVRIIVPDIPTCYEALGIIHEHYRPVPGLIKDYISMPKPNGYQSLHTTIFCEMGKIVEVQIRTPQMHDHAENGIAAHWAYAEQNKIDDARANIADLAWINNLKDFIHDISQHENLSQLKTDLLRNRIYVFTPRGEVKDLPEGATPIDFAYAIHTGLGHAIQGAKVNGKIVPLDHALTSGDVVEIIKRKNGKPSYDWLKMVKTGEARRKIKSWYNQQEPKKEVSVVGKKNEQPKKGEQKTFKIRAGEPVIEGQQGLLYKLARCCKPSLEDKIKGYLTANRGVTIHAITCANLKNAPDERLFAATWAQKTSQ